MAIYIRVNIGWGNGLMRCGTKQLPIPMLTYYQMCSLAFTWGQFHVLKNLQYIPRTMHTVFALLCFVVVIHWLIFPYPSGLLHWHCGNLTIAPVPAKQPWWIWINTSCEFIMNDCITTTKQSTTKPCAYFLGYTVVRNMCSDITILKSIPHLPGAKELIWRTPVISVRHGQYVQFALLFVTLC